MVVILNDMFIFNDIIGHLGLLELPIKGRSYTWSNMQDIPLLEQLDWFFTSVDWISDYPMTEVLPLARTASDHVPCVINVATCIPKAKLFRFEKYWVNLPGFMECVQDVWNMPSRKACTAGSISAKFKALRVALKKWHVNLSKIKAIIANCNTAILFFDGLEELRALTWPELNFR